MSKCIYEAKAKLFKDWINIYKVTPLKSLSNTLAGHQFPFTMFCLYAGATGKLETDRRVSLGE